MLDSKGQLSIEYLFLLIILLMIVITSIQVISEENELNIALNCAKSGEIYVYKFYSVIGPLSCT